MTALETMLDYVIDTYGIPSSNGITSHDMIRMLQEGQHLNTRLEFCEDPETQNEKLMLSSIMELMKPTSSVDNV